MTSYSADAAALVNQTFLTFSQHTDSLVSIEERVQQEIMQAETSILDLQADLEKRKLEMVALQDMEQRQPKSHAAQEFKQRVEQLMRVAHPLSYDLSNLYAAYCLIQLFVDFMLCQAFRVRMLADFEDIDPGYPPIFRYGLSNPYQRPYFLFLLRSLLVFKEVKHAASAEQLFPDIPPKNSLLKLLFGQLGQIKNISDVHNMAVHFIAAQYGAMQEIDLHDTNDVLEQQLAQLQAISSGETCFSAKLVPKSFQFVGEFWKIAKHLDSGCPNFPMAAHGFQCLNALGGECWRYKHLYFFCIFETQFNDIKFDYQTVQLPSISDNDGFHYAVYVIQMQLPDLFDYFQAVKCKIVALFKLIDALCPQQENYQQLLQFAFQLLANKFLALFVSPECVSNLQYFKALFKLILDELAVEQCPRVKLQYAARKFGYPNFAPNGSICHQKTFLDVFELQLEKPEYDNYFIQQLKERLRKSDFDCVETINLEEDVQFQLGQFERDKTYQDFGLAPLAYDFTGYITDYMLRQQRDLIPETKRAAINYISNKKALEAKASNVISAARANYQQRMRAMIAEIDQLSENTGRQTKTPRTTQPDTEAAIRERYRPLPEAIYAQIRQIISEIQAFQSKLGGELVATSYGYSAAKPEAKGTSDAKIDAPVDQKVVRTEFITPNCVARRLTPQMPASLLFLSDFNALDAKHITFSQQSLNEYFDLLAAFKFDSAPFYSYLDAAQMRSLRKPWNALYTSIIDDEDAIYDAKTALQQRVEQIHVSIDRKSYEGIYDAICEKFFKKQVSLEEAALQLTPLTERALPFNYQFAEALEHVQQYVRDMQSTAIVIDPLPLCMAFKSAMYRFFVLLNRSFQPVLPSGSSLQLSTLQQISHIAELFFEYIGQKVRQSTEKLTAACSAALGQYLGRGQLDTIFPLVPPLATPQNIYRSAKLSKYYSGCLEKINKQYAFQFGRKSEAQLESELALAGITPLGQPLGFCVRGTPQHFLYPHLTPPFSTEPSLQIPLLDLLQKAHQASVYVIKAMSSLMDMFAPAPQLQQQLNAPLFVLFNELQQCTENLLRMELEVMVCGCKVIWCEVGRSAYCFARQERLNGALTAIPDCESSALLRPDSTPCHTELVLAVFDKLPECNCVQNAAFQCGFVRIFVRALLQHVSRLDLRCFEDVLLLKAEIAAYERRIRNALDRCELACGNEAADVTTLFCKQLDIIQSLKRVIGVHSFNAAEYALEPAYVDVLQQIWLRVQPGDAPFQQ